MLLRARSRGPAKRGSNLIRRVIAAGQAKTGGVRKAPDEDHSPGLNAALAAETRFHSVVGSVLCSAREWAADRYPERAKGLACGDPLRFREVHRAFEVLIVWQLGEPRRSASYTPP